MGAHDHSAARAPWRPIQELFDGAHRQGVRDEVFNRWVCSHRKDWARLRLARVDGDDETAARTAVEPHGPRLPRKEVSGYVEQARLRVAAHLRTAGNTR